MKKQQTTKADAKKATELTERLGPIRKVVRSYKAKGTESALVLVLSCDHKRVGTPRKALRCGRCKGSK